MPICEFFLFHAVFLLFRHLMLMLALVWFGFVLFRVKDTEREIDFTISLARHTNTTTIDQIDNDYVTCTYPHIIGFGNLLLVMLSHPMAHIWIWITKLWTLKCVKRKLNVITSHVTLLLMRNITIYFMVFFVLMSSCRAREPLAFFPVRFFSLSAFVCLSKHYMTSYRNEIFAL